MRRIAGIALLAAAALTLSATNARAQATDAGACTADSTPLGDLDASVTAAVAAAVAPSYVVNGNTLTAHEQLWLDWVATHVYPSLPSDMTCAQKLDTLANVFWWTLKEGDIGAKNPPAYSNCEDDHVHHPWNFVCPGMWQVGFGVQAWDHGMPEVESAVARTYGSDEAALRAAFDASGLEAQGISWDDFLEGNMNSARLRRSWLERAPAVGFVLENPDVVGGCVKGAASWCRMPASKSSRWPEAVRYAPTVEAARESMQDVRKIFAAKGLCN